VPVTATLDLKALASVAGTKKAELADPGEAERSTGYVRGGISPLGQKRPLPTFIDSSASDWETVFVSGGRRGLEIELAPADLAEMTGARFAPIVSAGP
jgi:Cys-tRNA(Pro)/Cys-tRNA(Cys) deacylase